jgi:hypothetical protein
MRTQIQTVPEAEVPTVLLAVMHHESVHPLGVRPLSVRRLGVLQARGLPDLVQKLRFRHRLTGGAE